MISRVLGCQSLFSVAMLVAALVVARSVRGGDSSGFGAASVDLEEVVYSFEQANNGAGPMWCFGNSCVVRRGDVVFVSGLHTLLGAKPLNNCVPSLMRRDESGWTSIYRGTGRTREPSPLGILPDERVFLSVNPTIGPVDAYSGPSEPAILEFPPRPGNAFPRRLTPKWHGQPQFTEHSYRSFSVDGPRHEMVLFQNVGYTHAEWSFRNRSGQWSAAGELHWPRDVNGSPIRICYPTVALDRRRVFLCGVTDIVEPNAKWLDYKRNLTGRQWDYVFRRLYFTWCDDISTGEFHPWVEIANREATAGALFPNDLLVHANGDVALLWSETAIDERLRDAFFADARQRQSLEYGLVRDGRLLHRRSLIAHDEGEQGQIPGRGRFHVTPDGRQHVLSYVSAPDGQGNRVSENWLLAVNPDGTVRGSARLSLEHPLSSFFTNTVRAGCAPSKWLDVFGQDGNKMRYARIRLP